MSKVWALCGLSLRITRDDAVVYRDYIRVQIRGCIGDSSWMLVLSTRAHVLPGVSAASKDNVGFEQAEWGPKSWGHGAVPLAGLFFNS